MSMQVMVMCGAAVGAGAAVLVSQVRPAPPRLDLALERMDTSSRRYAYAPAEPSPWQSGVQRVLQRAPGRLPAADLRLLGTAPERFLMEKGLLALLGMLFPIAPYVMSLVMGLSVPVFVPGIAGMVAAVVLWLVPDMYVRQQADEARQEFTHACSAFLDLVATRMASNVGALQALHDAAGVGRSWAFVRIKEALERARSEQSSPWSALEQLGEELRLPLLGDLADIMRLSSDDGAAVYDTLRNRAAGLNNELLAGETTEANQASEKMSVPTALVAVLVIVLVAFPAVQSLFTI
ncbi:MULTISPECIES: type II secretion system F family protein [Streptomyces]|uniref:Type II secretion system protein GspF domain-containing protein n=1 Tax=Streptomyces odorifer TaxID=53450 RepID=A0A7Y6CCL5_9ACTN|nr:type II secretion system F family protein [Streptomyces odorifer]NUV30860.1 hypothetical protein [Streptomyces odorifer]NUV32872.1 hypothetical protein [Streptomyces sp. KAI-27]NUV45749.1 hypothetical protein [Streptomyces sp. CAI-78]